jgi:Tfp pilus assembly protein PilF
MNIARTYHSMVEVLQEQGDLIQAMDLFQQSLELKKQSLGGQYPSVANPNNAMATVLQKQGKFDDAVELHTQSLELKRLSA